MKNLTFLSGREGGGNPFINFNLDYIVKHMKMFCFKFQQNRTINEELDFRRGEGKARGPLFINSKLNHYW